MLLFFFTFIQWSYLDFVAFRNKFCTLAKSAVVLCVSAPFYATIFKWRTSWRIFIFFSAISRLIIVVVLLFSHTICCSYAIALTLAFFSTFSLFSLLHYAICDLHCWCARFCFLASESRMRATQRVATTLR